MARPPGLRIQGARQNNLKNVSLEIPHDRLTVVTGVSGSGKSSLAFDTLFAEGQWRYIESLSTYARMFLERIDRRHQERFGVPIVIGLGEWFQIVVAPGVFLVAGPCMKKLGFHFGGESLVLGLNGYGPKQRQA
jgi:hypothetical protein